MEDNQVPDEQVIATINKNGISFHPSEKYLKAAQESGVSAKVVEALRAAKFVGRIGLAFTLQENRGADAGRTG